MKVLVTGGTGRIGSETTRQLLALGHEVRAIDLAENADQADIEGAEYARCDILDYDSLVPLMEGCDTVVHMAAIPSPGSHPGPVVFQTNVSGSFNVFEAAAQAGIKRIVQASSINALGCAWGLTDMVLNYFPVDEAHVTHTTDVYSLSKRMIEDVGAYYWRREGISSVGMRFPAVWLEDWLPRITGRFPGIRAELDAFVALPEAERRQRLADVREKSLVFRARRSREYPIPEDAWTFGNDDWLLRSYVTDRFNFWAYVHVEDAARAIIQGLTADYDGSHALFINAERNWLNYDTETLLRLFFPDVTERTRALPGADSLVSIDKARALIGFAPQFTVDV